MGKSTKAIIKVDFKNIDRVGWGKFSPAILVFDKTIFRLSSWEALLKIFYYLCYKASSENAKYFDSQSDRTIEIAYEDSGSISFWGRSNNLRYVFTSTYQNDISCVKFGKNCYVACYHTQQPSWWNRMESSVVDNLIVINKVVFDLKLEKPIIYLSNPEADLRIIHDEKNKTIKKITDVAGKNGIIEKNARYVIAHINGEVLSAEEKFYRRINVEFEKKTFLGDIVISSTEEKYLHDYTENYLRKRIKGDPINMPIHPKVFAFGLVRYAMKYYGKRTFFPYFKTEYGIELDGIEQGKLHEHFQNIMQEYDKLYDETAAMKIDNISMHCFVTDKCAPQFFDYIFEYWRLDLNRNIENIYGESGPALFNRLIEEIKANNVTAVNNIMKHTSMALVMNEKSGRMRIKRFLQLIDKCFWERTEVPQTGNRFNRLLKEWMDDPKSKFQTEYQKAIRLTYQKGEKLLSHPLLAVRIRDEIFSIKLPRQILPLCEQDEYPIWTIKGDNGSIISKGAQLMEGRIALYTEECEVILPACDLFGNIRMTLNSEKRRYASFSFKKSNIRFFNDKGVWVDHEKGFLPEGILFVYSDSPNIPQIIYRPTVTSEYCDGMYMGLYNVERGDILKFSNERAIPVGNDITEGLTENALDGAKMQYNGDMLPIYPVLPKIIFKTTRDRLTGTAITVTDANGTEQFVKVSNQHYYELKLDSSLDDSYAYIIDLSEFILKDGIYKVILNIPGAKAVRMYGFAYLKDFKYRFINAPYIFKDSGEVTFPAYVPLNIDDDWTTTSTEKSLAFSFNEQTEYGKSIKDCKIDVGYNLNGSSVIVSIDVPALFWKYSKQDNWNYRCPADVSLKNLSRTLYVRGPFDFKNKSFKLCVDNNENIDETDIYASHQNGADYYSFNLDNARSWIDRSKACRTITMVLDKKFYPFLRVICRSVIIGKSIYYDYETQMLHGKFNIIGDSDFTVKVEHDGQMIGQDIPLENGQFVLETDSPGGDYLVTVYEIIDSDDGFDADTIKIGEYTLSLFDITKLTGDTIELKSFRDAEGKFRPLKLDLQYFIVVEELLENPDIDLINGIWKVDLGDEAQLKKCTFYRGILKHYDGAASVKDFDVLVVFFSKADTTRLSVLREYNGEYVELLYDYKTHILIQSDEGLTRLQKLERIELLSDDRYDCEAEILKSLKN